MQIIGFRQGTGKVLRKFNFRPKLGDSDRKAHLLPGVKIKYFARDPMPPPSIGLYDDRLWGVD